MQVRTDPYACIAVLDRHPRDARDLSEATQQDQGAGHPLPTLGLVPGPLHDQRARTVGGSAVDLHGVAGVAEAPRVDGALAGAVPAQHLVRVAVLDHVGHGTSLATTSVPVRVERPERIGDGHPVLQHRVLIREGQGVDVAVGETFGRRHPEVRFLPGFVELVEAGEPA